MTPEQINKWAIESGICPMSNLVDIRNATPQQLHRFATLVRNATLEEAALNPGEPFGYVNTNTGQFFRDVEDCRKGNEGHWRTVYTAHPAQTPQKGLFVDLIAQHPGLAEELKAIEAEPSPAQTPPPRLDGIAMANIWNKYSDADGWYARCRALETAVRKQFGVNDD